MKKKKACQIAINVLPSSATEVATSQLKIIATLAEAIVIRPHSGTSRLIVINQGGDSVAT